VIAAAPFLDHTHLPNRDITGDIKFQGAYWSESAPALNHAHLPKPDITRDITFRIVLFVSLASFLRNLTARAAA
jgi:hypothetical protein